MNSGLNSQHTFSVELFVLNCWFWGKKIGSTSVLIHDKIRAIKLNDIWKSWIHLTTKWKVVAMCCRSLWKKIHLPDRMPLFVSHVNCMAWCEANIRGKAKIYLWWCRFLLKLSNLFKYQQPKGTRWSLLLMNKHLLMPLYFSITFCISR